LLSNETWDILVHEDTVWVGTQNGINYFARSSFNLLQETNIDYHMKWTSLKVNKASMLGANSFTYDQNKLEFHFLGILLNGKEKLKYRYKLNGIDEDWNFTTSTKVILTSLEAGDYELIVQAKGKNKRWEQNEIKYAFSIQPPFWRTWWFISLYILVGIGVIYLFFKIRVLTYNKDVVREILKYVLRKTRRDSPVVTIKHNGKKVRLYTHQIHYLKTDRNYLELYTSAKKYVIRSSINDFFQEIPDKMEFVQVHRSYVIRIEHIQQKGKKELIVLDQKIPVGRKYQEKMELIHI